MVARTPAGRACWQPLLGGSCQRKQACLRLHLTREPTPAAAGLTPHATKPPSTFLRKQEAEGWQALLEACGKCATLQVLSLKDCGIGGLDAAGREQVAQLLGKCPMGVLDVSHNTLVG
jgi:hypothetical protein